MAAAERGSSLSARDFIDVVYEDVYAATSRSIKSALEQPSGRQPAPRLVAMHEWFTSLSGDDKEMLSEVVRYAADYAIFGVLCLLDNVQPVVDGYRETLELFVCANGEQRKLTDEGEELHGLFRSRVDESAGWDA